MRKGLSGNSRKSVSVRGSGLGRTSKVGRNARSVRRDEIPLLATGTTKRSVLVDSRRGDSSRLSRRVSARRSGDWIDAYASTFAGEESLLRESTRFAGERNARRSFRSLSYSRSVVFQRVRTRGQDGGGAGRDSAAPERARARDASSRFVSV